MIAELFAKAAKRKMTLELCLNPAGFENSSFDMGYSREKLWRRTGLDMGCTSPW